MPVFSPRDILRALNAHGVRYVIIGNLGGTLYGSPLATTDADLVRRSTRIELRDGLTTTVAALEDIIASKEAADREKDRLALPTLRLLLQTIREREEPPRS